jgi:phospholipid/cholesterol/gamma-HCH transport system substrate-binding protein
MHGNGSTPPQDAGPVKPVRRASRTLLGAITLLIVVGFTLGVLSGLIGPQMFAGGGRTVRAVFADAQQLIPGDEVRVQGVPVGSVTGVHLNPGGRSSTVVMSVSGSAGALYRDATATIAWKTLLGGAFNVDLGRGTPSAGSLDGATIPLSRTTSQVSLDDLLSFDQAGARTGLQRMPGQLAIALSSPRPPARLLSSLASASPSLAGGLSALRGQVPDSDLRDLISSSAATVHALDAPGGQLTGLVRGAAGTVAVTAARASALQSALDAATPALQQTKTTFGQLRTTLALANPLLRSLYAPAVQVAPTVARLYPTVVGARSLLDKAVPLLHSLGPALRSLASASRRGLPFLDQLQPTVDRLQSTILPYLNTIDPGSDHTTAEMIGPTTEALGPDIAGQMDQNGHFIRFPATGGSSPLYLPCQTYFANPSVTDPSKLVQCESLQQMLTSVLNYNPLSTLLSQRAKP